MSSHIHLHSMSDLFKFFKMGTATHPLVAVVDFSKFNEHGVDETTVSADFYSIMFKNYSRNTVKYGRKPFDFQDGSLICIGPNQIIEMDNDIEVSDHMLGWGLFFHPDLIRPTALNEKMKDYHFFSYEMSEALHLSDKEKQILYDSVLKIEAESKENIDVHSQNIIVSAIELLLNYCSRFYGRQFITRKASNNTVLAQIEKVLHDYEGIPTVKYLAEQVNLSSSYLSDLLKKETGKNAQEHIHFHVIEKAKSELLGSDKSVSEIAYALGFEYPQYFNKLFKQKTGKTPLEFRITH